MTLCKGLRLEGRQITRHNILKQIEGRMGRGFCRKTSPPSPLSVHREGEELYKNYPLSPPPLRKEGEEKGDGSAPLLDALLGGMLYESRQLGI